MGAELDGTEVAIIGMAGRFPGAPTLAAFWHNLRLGVESIAFPSADQLRARGLDPARLADPHWVKACAVLPDFDAFDAAFFGIPHREAELLDPQHRVFLECSWQALEAAGYLPDSCPLAVGVFAGGSTNTYLLFNLLSHPALLTSFDPVQLDIASSGDFLTTRVSYKLNLRGPSQLIQSACSTSLVAVHSACQSLLNQECDLALAGGVSINVTHPSGYRYLEGGIVSPDGHCRAFDARAEGTIFGSGVGVLVLRRLEDALAAGDTVLAVIKGSAVNNDGAAKVGYTAPSVAGQAAVIREALSAAGVSAASISYVEAHGTATVLGDPIEVAALTQAYRSEMAQVGGCAIGTVKTNVGHLGAVAGVAGLIKTVLALQHGELPPSLHYTTPNPAIDFAQSPFYVNTELRAWERGAAPRRAGVSSFGVGGTNAHVIVEEAPPQPPSDAGRPYQLLLLSAKSLTALNNATENLASYLQEQPQVNLADVAYTLQIGRQSFEHRRALVCHDAADAVDVLRMGVPERLLSDVQQKRDRPVAFMIPGQGAQYAGMARELYQREPAFRATVDRCAELLLPLLGSDIRDLLYSIEDDKVTRRQGDKVTDDHQVTVSPSQLVSREALDQTEYAQPALFVVAYALAQLWLGWGVQPRALIGHSLGEYVAACLAGVFSLADALALVVARGRLMQALPEGAMLAVGLSERAVQPLLGAELALAAVNGPAQCVISGPVAAVAAVQQRLSADGVECRRLHTSHAFHSKLIEPMVAPFLAQLRKIALHAPQLAYISNLTGEWITDAQATDPHYWAAQLRQPVRFADGLQTLVSAHDPILLEVGPGATLGQLAQQQPTGAHERVILASLRHARDPQSDEAFLLTTLGKLWLAGTTIDWAALYAHERRQRLPLPTYPFERQRYWIEPRGGLADYDPRAQPADAATPSAPAEPTEPARLPSASHARPDLQTPYVAPRSVIEQQIAAVWQDMLGVELVGVDDNFFTLGGHSLLALQLIARVRETFQVELPLNDFFAQPTVAGLALIITANQPEQDELDEIARILAEIEALTPEQLQASWEADAPAFEPPAPPEPAFARPAMPDSYRDAVLETHDLPTNGRVIDTYAQAPDKGMQFSLYYFSSDEQEFTGDKYRLLIEGAKFADRAGLAAIWTPERHFHQFGGLYPSPSALNGALAMITDRVQLRAGSVVLPLHHPIQIAEEWSVIDNLSKGRVGIAFASGWHADDFVFYPDHFAERKDLMFEGIEVIRRLWRGEPIVVRGGTGRAFDVRLFPKPIQRDLPIWVTAGSNPDTFIRAGALGANILTALIEQSFEQLTSNIELYRAARAQHGYDPQSGQITVMLHTFIGDDLALVKEQVRRPFSNYLRSLSGLLRNLAKSLDLKMNVDALSKSDEEALIAFAFERYFTSASLFGTLDSCSSMIARLQALGVDEIACFIDFGVDVDLVLASLQHLQTLNTHYRIPTII
jgi:natural product biosynthesis luciferase-like monooxygenase protein